MTGRNEAPTRVVEITQVILPDGRTKFVPRGQRGLDTAETLERDGLIANRRNERDEVICTALVKPDHPRVICWALGVNQAYREAGWPEPCPLPFPYRLVRASKNYSLQ